MLIQQEKCKENRKKNIFEINYKKIWNMTDDNQKYVDQFG